jgi:myosin heavy subunit
MELRLQAAILVLNRRYGEAREPVERLVKLTGVDAPIFRLLEDQRHIRERESRIDEQRRQHAELLARHDEMRRLHAELERQYCEDADENTRKRQVLFDLQLELQQKASELSEVEELALKEKDLVQQNALMRSEIAKLKQVGDRLKAEGKATARELAALHTEHEGLRRSCRDQREANEGLRNRLGQAKREYHEVRATKEARTEERRAIELRVQELASLINKTVGDVQTDPFDNRPLVQFLQDMGRAGWRWSTFRDLQMDIEQLRQQLEEIQRRIVEREPIHEQKAASVRSWRAKLARLQEGSVEITVQFLEFTLEIPECPKVRIEFELFNSMAKSPKIVDVAQRRFGIEFTKLTRNDRRFGTYLATERPQLGIFAAGSPGEEPVARGEIDLQPLLEPDRVEFETDVQLLAGEERVGSVHCAVRISKPVFQDV